MKEKRFIVGQELTYLSFRDPRAPLKGSYWYSGADQKGKGKVLNYSDYCTEQECWSLNVSLPGISGGDYKMLEKEFEEYHSETLKVFEITVDHPYCSPLTIGERVVFIKQTGSGSWNVIRESEYPNGIEWSIEESQCKPALVRTLDSSGTMYRHEPAYATVEKPFAKPVKPPYKMCKGDLLRILVDNPWGSSLKKGQSVIVYRSDENGGFVYSEESGDKAWFGNYANDRDFEFTGLSVSIPTKLLLETESVKPPEKPSGVKHTKPITFKEESDSIPLINLKHHKPIVIKGV